MEEYDEEIIQKVRDLLGEHYHNWSFAVEDIEGNFYYDHSTPLVGQALMANALAGMVQVQQQMMSPEIIWDDSDEWDDYE